MPAQIRRRRILIAALAGATLAALGITVASSHATQIDVRELPESTARNTMVASLAAHATYRASLITPTPTVTPETPGWKGTQLVSHRHGKVRYETAALFWKDYSGREVDVISGPAMTLSPAAAIAQPRSRIPDWNFTPYESPSPVQRWTVSGRRALYFDATPPPLYSWTLVGRNPPDRKIDPGFSFRMAALSVRGKTVVIVITGPVATFRGFLPIAKRLVASLRFPPS